MVNLCYNRLPRLRQEIATLPVDESEDAPDITEAAEANPPHAVEDRQRLDFLHQRIAGLPESMRMMLLLRYQQELPYEEIAEVMSVPLGTVKTGIFRAKNQLREALRSYEEVRT